MRGGNQVKRGLGCLAAGAALMGLALLLYTVLAASLAVGIASQLPPAVQPAVFQWLQGTPQAVGHPPDSDLLPGEPGTRYASGGYYWTPSGYSGPTGFLCSLPVAAGTLTSHYGDTENRTRPHTGIDYGTYGQSVPVYAPISGQVTHAGWSFWLGWTVVIENNGYQVILGHHCCGEAGKEQEPTGPSSLQVVPGQVIEAGTPVGLTGDTGNSFGIHLHFEVRQCSEEVCTIVDPSSVWLPGQLEACSWEALSAPP